MRSEKTPTFKLNTIPQSSEAHELPVLVLGQVWYLLLAVALLQPLVEALCDNDAPLLLLHGRPHAAVFDERVVTAVDGLHLGAVVGVALRPEGHQACRVVSANTWMSDV